MGNKSSKKKNNDEKEDKKPRKEYDEIKLTEICNIGHALPTPPLTMGSKLIFLSTHENKTVCSIYDLNGATFTTRNEEIKCDNENFNVNNTLYTINPNTNKIYFLENNKDILTLDLSNFQLTYLNKSITTTNKNRAQIIYNKSKDKVVIVGGEEKSDECDEYIIIPYSTAIKNKGSGPDDVTQVITKAGDLARILNVTVNENDFIYIMGGQKDFNNKGNKSDSLLRPVDSIWTVKLTDANGGHDWRTKTPIKSLSKKKKEKKKGFTLAVNKFYTQLPGHSFGVICYENKFLLCIGGAEFKNREVQKERYIWFLPLTKEYEKDGILMHCWYEIYLRLPRRGYYHAIYPSNNKKDILHLFNYNGMYYTIEMRDIMNKIMNRECHSLHPWTEAGKTAIPTKSKSVTNVGPKINDVTGLLDNLDLEEEYGDLMKENGYIQCEHIIEEADGLKDIVKDEKHLNAIIAKAKEVVDAKQQK